MDKEVFDHHLAKSKYWADILHGDYDEETVKKAKIEFDIQEKILNNILDLDKKKGE